VSHWHEWHVGYHDPGSTLARRLHVVQNLLGRALDTAPPGSVRLLSLCAGQARDVLGVVPRHPRRNDVRGRANDTGSSDFCASAASVLWTRHRRPPDLVPRIVDWFAASGFAPVDVLKPAGTLSTVGSHRLVAPPQEFEPGRRLFSFVR
jgi:hypothetical protein